MQMWKQKQQRFKWRSGRERGKDGTTGSFLDAAKDEAELIEKENSDDPNDDVTFVILLFHYY